MGWIRSLAALALTAVLAGLQACTLSKTLVHNFADLDDHRIFANREVAGPADVSRLRGLPQEPRFWADLAVADEQGTRFTLDAYLAHTRTAAFVVLHEDRVVLERYGRGYDQRSLLNSFSIAKAVMSTLVGIALAEGRIASLDTTVASVCPEFAGKPYGAATVRELLTMTSGIADAPSLLPGRAEAYHGDNLRGLALNARAPAHNGHAWRYSEADVGDAARLMAMVYVSYVDAIGACFEAKYHYQTWRPASAIAMADTDGNDATAPDAAWAPSLATPNHPEYPAAHSCTSGSVGEALRRYHGTPEVTFTWDSTVTKTTRTYVGIDAFNTEAGLARIHGGMHFRPATVAGEALGRRVAQWVAQRHFRPVD